MKLIYSRRALADLDQIRSYYAAHASPAIAEAIGRRLENVVDRICRVPEAAPRVSQRSQGRVVAVVRYPFRIFYRLRDDAIDILRSTHIEAARKGQQLIAATGGGDRQSG